MSKSDGINPEFRPEFTSLPGYLSVQDLLTISTTVQGAFSRLEVMDPGEAEHFLEAPAKAVAAKVKDGHMDAQQFIEVALVFSMIVTLADRDQRKVDEDEKLRRRVAEITEQETQSRKEGGDGGSGVPL